MHFYYCDPLSRQNAKWLSNAIESQSNATESIERNRISIEPIERNRRQLKIPSMTINNLIHVQNVCSDWFKEVSSAPETDVVYKLWRENSDEEICAN